MKILITGSSGMLGRALTQELSNTHEVIGLDIVPPSTDHRTPITVHRTPATFIRCDITDREETIKKVVSARPDLVVHTAAYTDVDGSESNPEQANQVNARGTQTVVLACRRSRSLAYYLSTDYVFDGEKETAYLESDRPNPVNVYGKSKLSGEGYIQAGSERNVIVRSSWLFGTGGRNFVDSLLSRAEQARQVEVVDDQLGSPTYTQDLAQGISELIASRDSAGGIYHITNSGSCSWYEFAQAIKRFLGLDVEIIPVSSEQYPRAARRPKMSILDNRRFREYAGELRPWPEALKEYLYERAQIKK